MADEKSLTEVLLERIDELKANNVAKDEELAEVKLAAENWQSAVCEQGEVIAMLREERDKAVKELDKAYILFGGTLRKATQVFGDKFLEAIDLPVPSPDDEPDAAREAEANKEN